MFERMLVWWAHKREVHCARRQLWDALREQHPDYYSMQNGRYARFMRVRWNAEHVQFLKSRWDVLKALTVQVVGFIAEASTVGMRYVVRRVCRVCRPSSQVNAATPEGAWGVPRVVSVDTKEITA